LTTSTEDDIMPFWSPDGRYVTFERVMPDHDDVYRVPASGGKEQKLAETLTGSSWSPDGRTLAVGAVRRPGADPGIFLVSIDTGTRTRLTTARDNTTDQTPVFSPDGRAVAFQHCYLGQTERDIFVAPVSGGTLKQLTFDKNRIFGLTWTADSREVVFAATRGGSRGLWRFPARG